MKELLIALHKSSVPDLNWNIPNNVSLQFLCHFLHKKSFFIQIQRRYVPYLREVILQF